MASQLTISDHTPSPAKLIHYVLIIYKNNSTKIGTSRVKGLGTTKIRIFMKTRNHTMVTITTSAPLLKKEKVQHLTMFSASTVTENKNYKLFPDRAKKIMWFSMQNQVKNIHLPNFSIRPKLSCPIDNFLRFCNLKDYCYASSSIFHELLTWMPFFFQYVMSGIPRKQILTGCFSVPRKVRKALRWRSKIHHQH